MGDADLFMHCFFFGLLFYEVEYATVFWSSCKLPRQASYKDCQSIVHQVFSALMRRLFINIAERYVLKLH